MSQPSRPAFTKDRANADTPEKIRALVPHLDNFLTQFPADNYETARPVRAWSSNIREQLAATSKKFYSMKDLLGALDIDTDYGVWEPATEPEDLVPTTSYPDGWDRVEFRRMIAKAICFIHGRVMDYQIPGLLPASLHANPTSAQFTAESNRIRHVTTEVYTALADRMLQWVVWAVKKPEFAEVEDIHLYKSRLKYWMDTLKEDLSVVAHWLGSITDVVDIAWIYNEQPARPGEPDRQHFQRFINLKFVVVADAVWRNWVDTDVTASPPVGARYRLAAAKPEIVKAIASAHKSLDKFAPIREFTAVAGH